MFAGSLVLGITLLCFAAWLHWNDTQGWPDESFRTQRERRYLARRRKSRRRIHVILAASGGLILLAAFVGPGRVWIAAWMSVMVALLTIVMLAGIDGWRTRQYFRDQDTN